MNEKLRNLQQSTIFISSKLLIWVCWLTDEKNDDTKANIMVGKLYLKAQLVRHVKKLAL